MNRDTVAGKFDQMKGKAKQSIGEAVGDDKLANSGTADQVKGAAKEAWGNTKDAAHTHAESHAHDVREKITSTVQNAKESINQKAEDVKLQHKKSA